MTQSDLPFPPPPSKRKRLIVAAVATTLVVSGAAGFYGYRKLSIRQEFEQIKVQALAAAKANDFAAAKPLFTRFLERNSGDSDVLQAWGDLILANPQPHGQHQLDAVRVYITLSSNYSTQDKLQEAQAARIKVTQLLDSLGAAQPAVEYASLALASNPNSVELRKLLVRNLLRVGKTVDAIDNLQQLIRSEPDDFESQNQMLGMLRENGKTSPEIEQFINDQLRITNGNTASMLNAMVWQFMNSRPARAEAFLRELLEDENIELPPIDFNALMGVRNVPAIQASTQPASRPAAPFNRTAPYRPLRPFEVRQLAIVLDSLNQRPLGGTLIDRYVEPDKTGSVRQFAVMRAWDQGNHQLVRKLLDTQDQPTDPKTQAGLITAAILRFSATGEPDRANAYRAKLATLPLDQREVAQTTIDLLLGGVVSDSARKTLDYARASGQFDVFTGTALATLLRREGQNEQAEALLVELSNAPVGWSVPSQMLVQIRRNRGNLDGALRAQETAFNRSGGSIEQGVSLAILLAEVTKRDRSDTRRLEALVEQIQKILPGEQRTLSILAELRASTDPGGARALLEKSIAANAQPSLDQLLEWVRISNRSRIGLERSLIESARSRFGELPQIMYIWAVLESQEGRGQQARAKLDDLLARAPEQDKREWREARVRFLSSVDFTAAREELAKLVDDFPNDIALQRNALNDPMVVDRALLQRAIDRVKAAFPNDTTWQVAQVRMQLDQSPTPEQLNENSALLSRVVQANPAGNETRLLLVEYLRRMGNLRAAIQQVDRGLAIDADQPQLILARVQLMIEDGQTRDADAFLQQIAGGGMPLTPVQRAMIAQMNLSLGNTQRAIETLAAARGIITSNDLQLAQLYLSSRDLTKAAAILDPLLSSTSVAPGVLLLGAQLREAQGDNARASALIDQLETAPDPTGEIRLLVAQYKAQRGQLEEATALISQVLTSDPSNVQAFWLSSQLALAQGNFDLALLRVADAHKADPKNPAILAAFEQSDRVRSTAKAGFGAVAASLLRNPTDDGIRDLADFVIASATLSTRQAQEQLDGLARNHANSPGVQIFIAERFLALGQPNRTAAIIRNLQARPGNRQPDAAKVAAAALVRARQFREALEQVQLFKAATSPQNQELVGIEVQANLGLQRYREALQLLEPIVNPPEPSPAESAPGAPSVEAVFTYARAAYSGSEPAKADAALEKLFITQPSSRFAWLRIASSELDRNSSRKWLDRVAADTPEESRLPTISLSIALAQESQATRFNDSAALAAAKAQIEKIAQQPDVPLQAMHMLAERQGTLDDNAAAAEIYRQILVQSPGDISALNNGAMAMLQSGAASEAVRLAVKASELMPDKPAIYDTVALAFLADNKPEQAIVWSEKSAAIESLDPHWKLTLVEALLAAKQRPRAMEIMTELRWFMRENDQWPKEYRDRMLKIESTLQPPRPTMKPTTGPTTGPTTNTTAAPSVAQ